MCNRFLEHPHTHKHAHTTHSHTVIAALPYEVCPCIQTSIFKACQHFPHWVLAGFINVKCVESELLRSGQGTVPNTLSLYVCVWVCAIPLLWLSFSPPICFHLFPHDYLLISEGKCEMGEIPYIFVFIVETLEEALWVVPGAISIFAPLPSRNAFSSLQGDKVQALTSILLPLPSI